MTYDSIIKQLSSYDLRPQKIMKRNHQGLNVVGISVWCNPLLKDDVIGVVKGIVDDGWVVNELPNEQLIVIKKKESDGDKSV